MSTARPIGAALACTLTLLFASCAPAVKSTESLEAGWHAMQPIRAKVLLLIPDELDRYVYFDSRRDKGFQIPLGRTAADQIDKLIGSAFTSSAVQLVASEAEARGRISRDDPELRGYDYIVLPTIMNVSSRDGGFQQTFEVDAVLEIVTPGGGRIERIKGHGEASIPAQPGSPPERSARTALGYAVDALKDGLEGRRGALSR